MTKQETGPHESNPRSVAQSTPRTPVLDLAPLEAIRALQRSDGPDLLNRVIDLYLESSPDLLAAMRESAARQDWPGVGEAAHSLKSSSANLGAMRLSGLCRELERTARHGDGVKGLKPLVERAEKELTEVCAALQALKGE